MAECADCNWFIKGLQMMSALLERYGQHMEHCPGDDACDCGFSAVIEVAESYNTGNIVLDGFDLTKVASKFASDEET